jgi:hypothetical protein
MAKHDKAKVSSGTFAEAASFGELDLIVRNNGRPTDFALDDIRGIAAFDDTFKQRCIQYFQAQLGFVNLANGRIQLTQPGRNNCNQYH